MTLKPKVQQQVFVRRFSLYLPEGRIRTVTQMQMIVWPDLEAPEEARYELTVPTDAMHQLTDLTLN